MTLLETTLAGIEPADEAALSAARAHNLELTKPLGAAGLLEETAIRLAGAYRQFPPPLPERVAVVIFAGDHGVAANGVSPYPQEVTLQMMANFANGGACINALARQFDGDVRVVNVGVAGDPPAHERITDRRVARGTDDLSRGPAMSREQALAALEVGIEVAHGLADEGFQLLLAGDMGIGNTTPSAALVARAMAPAALDSWVAGHRGAEPGTAVALEALGLRPLVALEQRLGEASGAAAAVPLVQASVRILRDMATFASAGVTHADEAMTDL